MTPTDGDQAVGMLAVQHAVDEHQPGDVVARNQIIVERGVATIVSVAARRAERCLGDWPERRVFPGLDLGAGKSSPGKRSNCALCGRLRPAFRAGQGLALAPRRRCRHRHRALRDCGCGERAQSWFKPPPGQRRCPRTPHSRIFRVQAPALCRRSGRYLPVQHDVDDVRHDVVEQALVVGDDDHGAIGEAELVHAVRDGAKRIDVEAAESVSSRIASFGSRHRHLQDFVPLLSRRRRSRN